MMTGYRLQVCGSKHSSCDVRNRQSLCEISLEKYDSDLYLQLADTELIREIVFHPIMLARYIPVHQEKVTTYLHTRYCGTQCSNLVGIDFSDKHKLIIR